MPCVCYSESVQWFYLQSYLVVVYQGISVYEHKKRDSKSTVTIDLFFKYFESVSLCI